MVNRVSVAGPGSPESSGITWPVRSGVIPALAEGFITRPESAPGFEDALVPGSTVVLTPARGSARPGLPDWLGSCGKTQLAVYLAESLWRSGELDLLVWITAASEGSILAGYAAAAVAAIGVDPAGDAEALATRFTGWLTETSRSWLVVLDGLSGSWDSTPLWPAGPAGRTLITTSDSDSLLARDQVLSFPLSGLSRREALSYLLGRLTEDRGQRSGAIDLVDDLGGEPLALAQVSAVIEDSALSCRDYLDHYGRKQAQLALPDRGRPAAAAITWTLSVEQAYRLLPGGPAQPLLILASMLDGNWIPGTVFVTPAAISFAGGESRGLARPDDAWAALTSLERTGLLTVERAGGVPVVRMNQAVQAAIRSATSADALDDAALAAASAVLQAWPSQDTDGWLASSFQACAEHAARLAGNLLWNGDGYRLLFRSGRSLESARLTRLAARHWSEVAEACEQFLGPTHADTLEANDRLAAAFLNAGRAADALPWFRRVLAERSATLGPEHQATIAAAIRLGRALLTARLADEAVAVLERAVTDCSHLRGAGHPDALDARDALASAYCASDQLTEGIRQYQRTLADRERVQGRTHPATLDTSLSLGDAYLKAERIKEAISQFKAVVGARERALGRDHPDTIAARGRLASAYYSAGRMAVALQMYEQVRTESERVLGTDHPDTLTRRVNLAHAYYAVGRIGDAKTLLRDTAERCDRVLPPGDPLAQTVRESLANISGN